LGSLKRLWLQWIPHRHTVHAKYTPFVFVGESEYL
jgi:hypothetical protein